LLDQQRVNKEIFGGQTEIFSPMLFYLWFVLLKSARSQSWRVEDIPNPMTNPELCGRIGRESSMICDVANLLDQDTKDSIDRRAGKMWEVEFAVVVIPSMVTSGWLSSVQRHAEYYANTLLQNWGVGDSSLQNGVLIFLSVIDRVIYISLGTEIQAKLSSADVDRVVNHVAPLLKSDEYGSALERAIIEINLIITRGITPLTVHQKERDGRLYMARVLGPWLLCIIFAVLVVWIFVNNKQDLQIKKSRDDLRALLIELSLPDLRTKVGQDLDFFSASCPVCCELYLPTKLRIFDRSLAQFLNNNQTSSSYQEIDDTAEDHSILPESYETALRQFVEESGKLRSSYNEYCSPHPPILDQEETNPNDKQENDCLLSKTNLRTRLETVLDNSDFRNPSRFGCGHIFCLSCLRTLSHIPLTESCPLCELEEYLSIPPENFLPFSTHRLPEPKGRDLVFRARILHKRNPTTLTKERLLSLESSFLSGSREESTKILFEMCCEVNRKVIESEMRKKHIDDRWKEPGRPSHPIRKSE
jgi:uncharacterized membrane protein YgcG